MDLPVFVAAIILGPDYIEKYVNQGKKRSNITFLLSTDQTFIDYLKLKNILAFSSFFSTEYREKLVVFLTEISQVPGNCTCKQDNFFL